MTANAMQEDKEECLAAGMNGYISKPLQVEELMQALLKVSKSHTSFLLTYLRQPSRGNGKCKQKWHTTALRQAAHTLKSSSAMLGAMTLAQQSQELETISKNRNLSEILSKVKQIIAEFTRVLAALQAELQRDRENIHIQTCD